MGIPTGLAKLETGMLLAHLAFVLVTLFGLAGQSPMSRSFVAPAPHTFNLVALGVLTSSALSWKLFLLIPSLDPASSQTVSVCRRSDMFLAIAPPGLSSVFGPVGSVEQPRLLRPRSVGGGSKVPGKDICCASSRSNEEVAFLTGFLGDEGSQFCFATGSGIFSTPVVLRAVIEMPAALIARPRRAARPAFLPGEPFGDTGENISLGVGENTCGWKPVCCAFAGLARAEEGAPPRRTRSATGAFLSILPDGTKAAALSPPRRFSSKLSARATLSIKSSSWRKRAVRVRWRPVPSVRRASSKARILRVSACRCCNNCRISVVMS